MDTRVLERTPEDKEFTRTPRTSPGAWPGAGIAVRLMRHPTDACVQPVDPALEFARCDARASRDHTDRLVALRIARKGNVQAMRWRDVDLDSRLWRIPNNLSKNREPLTIVLSPESVEILLRRRAAVDAAEYVFPGYGKTEHLVEPKSAWQRVINRAKLNDCRMHDLRWTLGAWQAAGGTSLLIIGKSLGHRSESATRIYARLANDPVRESVEKGTVAMTDAADGTAIINGGGSSSAV